VNRLGPLFLCAEHVRRLGGESPSPLPTCKEYRPNAGISPRFLENREHRGLADLPSKANLGRRTGWRRELNSNCRATSGTVSKPCKSVKKFQRDSLPEVSGRPRPLDCDGYIARSARLSEALPEPPLSEAHGVLPQLAIGRPVRRGVGKRRIDFSQFLFRHAGHSGLT
jgi:hypothetical protein